MIYRPRAAGMYGTCQSQRSVPEAAVAAAPGVCLAAAAGCSDPLALCLGSRAGADATEVPAVLEGATAGALLPVLDEPPDCDLAAAAGGAAAAAWERLGSL